MRVTVCAFQVCFFWLEVTGSLSENVGEKNKEMTPDKTLNPVSQKKKKKRKIQKQNLLLNFKLHPKVRLGSTDCRHQRRK